MRAPTAYRSARTARVAFVARRMLSDLSGLSATEALEVLGVTSGLLLAQITPTDRPKAGAILREQCASTLATAARPTIAGSLAEMIGSTE